MGTCSDDMATCSHEPRQAAGPAGEDGRSVQVQLLVTDGASVLALDAQQVEEQTGISILRACGLPPRPCPLSAAHATASEHAHDTPEHAQHAPEAGSAGKRRRLSEPVDAQYDEQPSPPTTRVPNAAAEHDNQGVAGQAIQHASGQGIGEVLGGAQDGVLSRAGLAAHACCRSAGQEATQQDACCIQGLVLSTGWRCDMPPLIPLSLSSARRRHAGVNDDAQRDRPGVGPGLVRGLNVAGLDAARAHVSQKKVLVVTLEEHSLEQATGRAGKQVHVYMDGRQTWIPRGLLPGALVSCCRLLLCAQSGSGGAFDTVFCAGPHTHVAILRTAPADCIPVAVSCAETPCSPGTKAKSNAQMPSREVMSVGHPETGVIREEDMVRVCDLQSWVERPGWMTMQGCISSLWRVTIEMVCSVCEAVAPPQPLAASAHSLPSRASARCRQARAGACAAPGRASVAEDAPPCCYALVVKAEGKFEDGSGTCRVELEGQELVLRSLLRVSKPGVQQLVAAALRFGRLTYQEGVDHDQCLKLAQASAILKGTTLSDWCPHGLSEATMLLYSAVQDALGAGLLTQLRVSCQHVPFAPAKVGSGGGKAVVMQGVSLGTTAHRPQVSPCSRLSCLALVSLVCPPVHRVTPARHLPSTCVGAAAGYVAGCGSMHEGGAWGMPGTC